MQLDSRTVVGRYADAALFINIAIRATLEDLHGAIDADDLELAAESVLEAAIRISVCDSMLANRPTARGEACQVLLLDDADFAAWALEPHDGESDTQAARTALRRLEGMVDERLRRIPFSMPSAREADGFFGTVRVMHQIEAIRRDLGLRPCDLDFE